jgi:hypothetical protein
MTPRQKYLLIALSKAADGQLSPIQVQKTMFLLREEAPKLVGDGFYKFVPYNYGPFCSDIYEDLVALEARGLIVTEKNRSPSIHSITKSGLDLIKTAGIDQAFDSFISDVVTWVKSQSFSSLLQAIYKKYPKYAVNSVFNK